MHNSHHPYDMGQDDIQARILTPVYRSSQKCQGFDLPRLTPHYVLSPLRTWTGLTQNCYIEDQQDIGWTWLAPVRRLE